MTKPTAMVLYKTQVDRIFAPGEPVTEDYEYWIGLSQKGYEENKKRAHIRLKLVEELGSDNPLTYSALHDGDSVVGFHIGKDRATAILAQNILRVMGPNGKADALPAAQVDGSGFFGISAPKAKEADMRQFIAFNDSRQQAAFFALFFDHNEQHERKKRLQA